MNPALHTAATGMAAQQARVDAISHNLANVGTTAYKRSRVQFETLLYQTLGGQRLSSYPGSETSGPLQIGRGVKVVANAKVHTQGPVEMTGRPLDFAIDGEGFFQVRRPDGTIAYTRDGSFSLSESGLLVTHNGEAVLPEIVIPHEAESLTVSPTGEVSATLPGNSEPMLLGRMELVRFVNPDGLMALGQNLYAETVASGMPSPGYPQEEGYGRIIQSGLEGSNVQVVQEMVDMITAMRAYEMNSRAISTADQMMEQTSALVR